MLRLQPTELGLTMSEVMGLSERLQQRRQARQLALATSMPGPHNHPWRVGAPQSRRGPARSTDEALTMHPGPYFHCVATTNDGKPFVDAETDGGDSGRHCTDDQVYRPLREASDSSGADVTPDLDMLGAARGLVVHSERPFETMERETQGSDRIAPWTSTTADRATYNRNFQNLLQLDGAEPTQIQPLRRFHAHSWSDPSEGIPQLTVPVRRTFRHETLPQRRRSSSTSGSFVGREPTASFHSRSQSAVVQGSTDESSYSSSSDPTSCDALLQSTILRRSSSEASAILGAVNDSVSPLDALLHDCALLSNMQPAWQRELPIRLSPQVQGAAGHIRWPTFSSDDTDGESPSSPHSRSRLISPTTSEEDELATPRARPPPAPRLRRVEPSPTQRSPFDVSTYGDTRISSPEWDGHPHHNHSLMSEDDTSSPSPPRIRRRPVPVATNDGATSHASVTGTGTPTPRLPEARIPRLSEADVPRQILQRQQATFYGSLAQANGGNLPSDAHLQWIQYMQHLITTPSPSYDIPHRTPALRRRPRRSDIMRPSESAGNRGLSDPFDSSPPNSASLERADPRGMELEFAVARGGRPRMDTTWRAPVQMSRSNVSRNAASQGSSFDQENIDGGEAWSRFEQERQRIVRAAAAGTGSSEDATPPGVGRLGRHL